MHRDSKAAYTYAHFVQTLRSVRRQGSSGRQRSFRSASSPPEGGPAPSEPTPTDILELKRDLFAAWREVAANQAAHRARGTTSEGKIEHENKV